MLLKQWIMRPLLDLDTIKERHDSIEWFIQQDLSSRKMLQDSLRRLRNIPKLLRAMNSKLSLADWQALHQFMFYSLTIRTFFRDHCHPSQLKIVIKILDDVPPSLFQQLSQHINDVASILH
ncbi:hypothetical protein RTP6_007445 [Batrachochytrium dendrobatidis]